MSSGALRLAEAIAEALVALDHTDDYVRGFGAEMSDLEDWEQDSARNAAKDVLKVIAPIIGDLQTSEGDLIADSLRIQIARLHGEKEAAEQAAREILKERNGWARELADMRDERDTARTERDQQRDQRLASEVENLNRIVTLELAIEQFLDTHSSDRFTARGIEQLNNVLDEDD